MADRGDIKFGCITCKRTKRNLQMEHAAEVTMEEILNHSLNFLQSKAGLAGFVVPDSFREKVFKAARKFELIAPLPVDPEIEAPGLPTDDLASPVPSKKAKTQ